MYGHVEVYETELLLPLFSLRISLWSLVVIRGTSTSQLTALAIRFSISRLLCMLHSLPTAFPKTMEVPNFPLHWSIFFTALLYCHVTGGSTFSPFPFVPSTIQVVVYLHTNHSMTDPANAQSNRILLNTEF
jgi:hypothetical protein